MNIRQLNHVALQVAEVERSVRFFRDTLGLTPMARPAFSFPGAWFRIGVDQELHLIEGREGAVFSTSRGNHFALMVDDLEAARRRLDEAGVSYTGPHRRPDGATQLFLQDPDGHVIELCTPPTADGAG